MIDFPVNMIIFLLAVFICMDAFNKFWGAYNSKKQSEFDNAFLLSHSIFDIDEIFRMFDIIIDDTINDYIILNAPFKDNVYINSEKEKELLLDISSLILARMTPTIMSKLSLVYNISSEEDLSDLVTKKTYIKVIGMVVEHNDSYTEIDNNPFNNTFQRNNKLRDEA